MNSDNDLDHLFERARDGDSESLAQLFSHYRSQLEQLVRLRMDRRVRGRFDPADVLQETFLEVSRRFPDYAKQPDMPPKLWFRFLATQRLLLFHRRHLGAKMRDASLEISIQGGAAAVAATSVSLAEQIAGSLTSPSQAAMRDETRQRLTEAFNSLEPIDREVLAMRHLEDLRNDDVALLLGLTKAAASNRYVRALQRLKEKLGSLSGLFAGIR